MKTLYLECDCGDDDHLVQVSWEDWSRDLDDAPEMYIDTQMRRYGGFFRRVWAALRYIFTDTPCGFGYWNCCIVNKETAAQLHSMLSDYLECHSEHEERR